MSVCPHLLLVSIRGLVPVSSCLLTRPSHVPLMNLIISWPCVPDWAFFCVQDCQAVLLCDPNISDSSCFFWNSSVSSALSLSLFTMCAQCFLLKTCIIQSTGSCTQHRARGVPSLFRSVHVCVAFCCSPDPGHLSQHVKGTNCLTLPKHSYFFLLECLESSERCWGGTHWGPKGFRHMHMQEHTEMWTFKRVYSVITALFQMELTVFLPALTLLIIVYCKVKISFLKSHWSCFFFCLYSLPGSIKFK